MIKGAINKQEILITALALVVLAIIGIEPILSQNKQQPAYDEHVKDYIKTMGFYQPYSRHPVPRRMPL